MIYSYQDSEGNFLFLRRLGDSIGMASKITRFAFFKVKDYMKAYSHYDDDGHRKLLKIVRRDDDVKLKTYLDSEMSKLGFTFVKTIDDKDYEELLDTLNEETKR